VASGRGAGLAGERARVVSLRMTPIRWAVSAGTSAALAGALAGTACGGESSATGDAIADANAGRSDAGERDAVDPLRAEGGVLIDATAASTNPDSGSAADARADPHNCGAPGHDCLGGACQAGVCQAVVLATAASGISSFAIDATSVYWTTSETTSGLPPPSNGTVSKCPLTGCAGAPTVLATGQDFPQDIVVTGSTLYWLDYNAPALVRCSTDCSDNPTTFNTWSEIWLGAFAVNDTQAYFTGMNGAGLVQECPSSGCTAPTTFASGQADPNDMVVGDANLYWLDFGISSGAKTPMYSDGGVMTCPLGGCDGGPTALATGLSDPRSLVVNGATAYWADGESVLACSVNGCNDAPTTIVTLPPSDGQVLAVAADATNVYFGATTSVDGFSWQVFACALGGCADGPTLLSSTMGGGAVGEIAVDATRVYFVSGDATQLLAIAK
jgi:hypothetical protein